MSKKVVSHGVDLEEKDQKKAFSISKDSPLHFLNITRSYDSEREFSKKIRFFGKDGFLEDGLKLSPEIDAYRLIAGYNEGSFGALQMLVNPKVVEETDHLGLVELLTGFIPLGILSEMLNTYLYEKSLLEMNNFAEAFNMFQAGLKAKEYKDAVSALVFTALWGLYQVIRVPVITAALLTAIVLWIPKMVIGLATSSLVAITHPLWYFPVAKGHEQYEKIKDEKGDSEHESLPKDGDDQEDDLEAQKPKGKKKTALKADEEDHSDHSEEAMGPNKGKGGKDPADSYQPDEEVDHSHSL